MKILKCLSVTCGLIVLLFLTHPAMARAPFIQMPWPQHHFDLDIEGQRLSMAYMDVSPEDAIGQTLLLLHGKNFNGWYWQSVMRWALQQGYRVVVPDQLGFGNSDYPDIHYSFHLLAANTHALLQSLGIEKVIVIGHSMGGMLATRFALMYPQMVEKLILEDPIGLEDYRRFVPYVSVDSQWKKESEASYQSYLRYQKGYFPYWKPAFDSFVRVQAAGLSQPDFKSQIAKANALTYEMIYQQPVCYEFGDLKMPVLLIIGREDRTIVGKALLSDPEKSRHGQYPELGDYAVQQMQQGQLRILPGVGHIPHIQTPGLFLAEIGHFLSGG